jgi:hypothetical protein
MRSLASLDRHRSPIHTTIPFHPPTRTHSYSKNLRTLIAAMLNVNPADRPTMEQILRQPFIKQRVHAFAQELMKAGQAAVNAREWSNLSKQVCVCALVCVLACFLARYLVVCVMDADASDCHASSYNVFVCERSLPDVLNAPFQYSVCVQFSAIFSPQLVFLLSSHPIINPDQGTRLG